MLDKIKDLSVVYSFDKSGFERHSRDFSSLNPARFAGNHYLVTGGSRGIGEAVAKTLLSYGAKVTVTARNRSDFDVNFSGRKGVNFVALDLNNFHQIMTVKLGFFNGVILNAGGMPDKLSVVDGRFDSIFGSQVVGHYLLLRRLFHEKRLATPALVHWVASGGMYLQKLKLNDLSWQQHDYNKVTSYANAKRAQVILNQMFAQRYKHAVFSCSHPGWVGTDALKEALPGFSKKVGHRMRTAEQGADTIVWCMEQGAKLKSGLFWFDRQSRLTAPFPWTRETEADRLELWRLLEDRWQDYKEDLVQNQPVSVNAETSVY